MNVLIVNYLLINVYAFIFLYLFKSVKGKKLFISITTIQLIILNGLRDKTVGTDTLRYEKRFIEVQSATSLPKLTDEPAYDILQRIVLFYTKNFNFWLFVVSIIMFVMLGIFIYKYSSNYYFSYIIFITLEFLDFSFSGIRQMLAMIIVLCSYKFILEKKPLKFVAFIFLASLFHFSALICLPIYVISNIKWNKMNLYIVISTYILMYLIRFDIGWYFLKLYYRGEPEMVNDYFSSNSIGRLSLFILILIILGVIITNPFKYKVRQNAVLINIMIASFFIQSLSSVSYLFTRLNKFYLFFIIIYLPNLLTNFDKLPKKIRDIDNRYYYTLLISSLILILTVYYINVSKDFTNLLPYSFFWE